MIGRRKSFYALIALFLISIGWAAYNLRDYLKDAKEFSILSGAFELRAAYEGGSRAYIQAVGRLENRLDEALYNLGNINFREGLLRSNLSLLMSAAEYYREALRDNPLMFEAKRNLELTELRVQKLKEELRQGSEREKKEDVRNDEEDKEQKVPGLEPYVPFRP